MNDNLCVWLSDPHVVSNATESGVINETHPADAAALAAYISSLAPACVFNTGDMKDHYGADTGDELDRYLEAFAPLRPAMKELPGNHDEKDDYGTTGSVTDFSLYDAKVGPPPYHWTLDWTAPKVRIIGIHSYIQHGGIGSGMAHVTTDEVNWLSAQLDVLPADWQVIVCSHFPCNPTFGAYINFIDAQWTYANPHPLRTLLTAHSDRIVAYLNGHRHGNMETNILDGIKHFNGPGVSYTLGNGYGGWGPITYDPAARTLTVDYLLGPPITYQRYAGYTPIVLQLPALPPPPPPTSTTYSFDAQAALVGDGPLSGSDVTVHGTVEVPGGG